MVAKHVDMFSMHPWVSGGGVLTWIAETMHLAQVAGWRATAGQSGQWLQPSCTDCLP